MLYRFHCHLDTPDNMRSSVSESYYFPRQRRGHIATGKVPFFYNYFALRHISEVILSSNSACVLFQLTMRATPENCLIFSQIYLPSNFAWPPQASYQMLPNITSSFVTSQPLIFLSQGIRTTHLLDSEYERKWLAEPVGQP